MLVLGGGIEISGENSPPTVGIWEAEKALGLPP